ncbi:VWA domain-containing protein [Methanohalophilus profundi]|uniref:VWA domain-containing protein n=1 Tax=Methanohalophilus profundi TaxID=2138083 RepID=UPI001CDD3D67|nr:VWA domain-containing protein [Methanohalophilus profundi]
MLILLSTAAAAPFYTSQEDLSDEHTVIIIDASASMQSGNRFDDATRLAEGYLSKKNSVILAKSSPEIVVENTGSSQASDALENVEPSDTIADLSGAMSEGMRLLSQRGGTMVVVSDFAAGKEKIRYLQNNLPSPMELTLLLLM